MSSAKLWIKFFRKISIILLIISWVFGGWPQIFHPSTLFRTGFPPKIQEAQAAVAVDAVSEGHNTSSVEVTSLTFSHTVVSNTNGILVVGVNMMDTTDPFPTVSTMTYAGQSMTFVARTKYPNDATARVSSELWYILAPATGANDIVITISASVRGVVAGGMSYTGVSQITPLGTAATAGGSGTAPSVAVTSAAGELVVDTVGIRQNSTGTQTLTEGAGQTERYEDASAYGTLPNNNNVVGAGSEEAGATSVTMSWTGASSANWTIVGVPLKPAAFPNGYSFRRLIDITDAQVSAGPHTNFPVLVSTTLADLKTTANGGDVTDAEGDDIIFTDSDGTTQLAHEVEKYVATTGELVAWVRVPSLASTSTIYIYYGNSSVTTFQGNVTSNGVTGVWDANFQAVWHLKEDAAGTGTADLYKDSTSNSNHGDDYVSSTDKTGKIGAGQDFDGTDDLVNVPHHSSLAPTSAITVSVWAKSDVNPSQYVGLVVKTLDTSYNYGYGIQYNSSSSIKFHVNGFWDNAATASITPTNWNHIVGTYDGSYVRIYINGVAGTPSAYTGSIDSSTQPLEIGRAKIDSKTHDGKLDEARISNSARSAGWILTEYNNQNSPSGFYAIGAEETMPAFNQSAYRLFNNVNSTDVGTALAAQNTAATLGSAGAAFRLRALLHVSDAQLSLNGQNFKLQFAAQSGTCDTAFSGETYADVTAATVIAYNNNATPADGDNLTANANDPTHGADTIVNQDYEELNNFTNSVAAIPAGQDGKWDFSLKDNNAPAGTAYCFRAVKSDATVLNTYTVIPQITTATAAPSQTLTFSISDNTIGFGTLSASAARYANGAGTGDTVEVEAHTLSASTNATSGYIITVDGTTLRSTPTTITITAIGGTNTASSPGTEQFGLRMTATGGNGAVSVPYAAAGFALDTAAFPDQVASDPDGDDVSTTYSVRYLANIANTTEAGSYSATLTYVATATF